MCPTKRSSMGSTRCCNRYMRRQILVLLAVSAVVAAVPVGAQVRAFTAELSPIVESDDVRAGTTVRTALGVRLPEGLHVNSNQPRDPLLIPIVLTVDPPPGVSVLEIVYPEPTDLRQEGADQPLSVFERAFAIGVRLELAEDLALGPSGGSRAPSLPGVRRNRLLQAAHGPRGVDAARGACDGAGGCATRRCHEPDCVRAWRGAAGGARTGSSTRGVLQPARWRRRARQARRLLGPRYSGWLHGGAGFS